MFLELSDPTNNQTINLFSPEVMNLIHRGYSIKQIIKLSKKIPQKYNRSNIFMDDLLLNYMIYMDLEDVKSLCLIDKNALLLYTNKYFWKLKIEEHLSHYEQFNEGHYAGAYTESNYIRVVKAIEKSECYHDQPVKYIFTNNDNLGKLCDMEDYDPLLYVYQCIKIKLHKKRYKVRITCKTLSFTDKYVSEQNIKICIFNIFYFYPDVNIEYLNT